MTKKTDMPTEIDIKEILYQAKRVKYHKGSLHDQMIGVIEFLKEENRRLREGYPAPEKPEVTKAVADGRLLLKNKRLRDLVREAYTDGWEDGYGTATPGTASWTVEQCWETSDIKKALGVDGE